MAKEKAAVFITDLDNTLFDWVDVWYQCFSAMLNEIVAISGVDLQQLKSEIRAVHQGRGTSEYAFLIEELPSLRSKFPNTNLVDVFAPAIRAYRMARRSNLKLYAGVAEGLLKIKGGGATIIGYTESMAFYSNYRVRRLGLDGVIDIVYSPQDHDLPLGLTAEDLRKYPAQHYEFRYTQHRHTPKGELKPNPDILQSIIRDVASSLQSCIYLGDSLVKDVAMAIDAGVPAVWAEYGVAQSRPEYALLREVTHWKDEDVQREKIIGERHVQPDIVLRQGFTDIFEYFEFVGAQT